MRRMAWLPGVLLSVVITLFAFPPYGLGALMLVGLVPVFLAADSAPTARAAFFRVWVYVFLGNAAICAWVAYAVREFAQVSAPLAWGSVLALSLFEQIAWPTLAALRFLVRRRLGVRPILWTPAAIFALENFLPKIFPNTMGNVFYSVPWLAQAADIAGVTGLTALLAASNEYLASLFGPDRAAPDRVRHRYATAVFVGGIALYAGVRYGQVRGTRPESQLRVAIVQPNVNSAAKVRAAHGDIDVRREILTNLVRLSGAAQASSPALIVWPETSFPGGYRPPGSETLSDRLLAAVGGDVTNRISRTFDEFVAGGKTPYLFGATADEPPKNSLFLVRPGVPAERYDKTKLLVIGETTPLGSIFPTVGRWAAENGAASYMPGDGPRIFTVNGVRLGPMICLEGLYGRYVRSIVKGGAQVLVSATNDSWFGPGREPWLHLSLTTFRAIETRRPIVRATNTGISALVDIDGRLIGETALDTERVVTYDVPVYPTLTSPYLLLGDAWVLLALGWTLLPFWRHRRANA